MSPILHVGGAGPRDEFGRTLAAETPAGSAQLDKDAAVKTALVLGGGGVVGGGWELGALLALEKVKPSTSWDMYVGTSAGAFVAACLAAGIGAPELARAQGESESRHVARLSAQHVLRRRPAERGMLRALIGRAARRMARARSRASLLEGFFALAEDLSAWRAYSTEGIATFIRGVFETAGRSMEFADLESELYLTGTDIDTGERVVFGAPGAPAADIPTAVAASAALPAFYGAVRLEDRDYVDGGLASPCNVDIALSMGATHVVIINPLVPYLERGRPGEPRKLGNLIGQVFRIMARAQLQRELDAAALRHPDASLVMIEPVREDDSTFVFNLMDFRAWPAAAAAGYSQVLTGLSAGAAGLNRLLEGAGIAVSEDLFEDALAAVREGRWPDGLLVPPPVPPVAVGPPGAMG